MSRLKLDKSQLRLEKAELQLEKVQSTAQQTARRNRIKKRLYEKARPSDKLHEAVKPSEKLIVEKKHKVNPELQMGRKKIPAHLRQYQYKREVGVKVTETPKISELPVQTIVTGVHQGVSSEDDNVGVKTANQSAQLCEHSAIRIHSMYRNEKLRQQQRNLEAEEKLHRAEEKLHREAVKYRIEKHKLEHSAEYSQSNPYSKWQQKQRIKKKYREEYRLRKKSGGFSIKTGRHGVTTGQQSQGEVKRLGEAFMSLLRSSVKKPEVVIFLLIIFLMLGMLSALVSVATTVVQSAISGAFGTSISSYTAKESVLLRVEESYVLKETLLQNKINTIEANYPNYDEYRYNLAEIGHDPHDLAALLTALYQAYTYSEVQTMLDTIFAKQYKLTIVPSVVSWVDSDGNYHQITVLTTTLTNKNIHSFAQELLTDDEYEHYLLLRMTKGNMPDLFGDYYGGSAGSVGDLTFEIPDHYLDDDAFARVYAEAIKYLGYPYTWGGQSPTTSFDCSGFMYWIYNATGVYSHSRLTAAGYYSICTKFGADQRQAGDLIFFTGTSNHATISHVGMYVGDGMMIHSASAGVSFVSVDSGYWANSGLLVCYGRLPI